MKKLHIVVLGVALGAASALPVWAAEGETVGQEMKGAAESVGQGVKNGAEATGHAVKEGAKKTGEFLGITSADATQYEATERADHRMEGHITRINHKSGIVGMKTAEAPLQLRFAPKAVSHLHKGDKITVELAYAMVDTGTDAAEGRAPNAATAYDAPKAGGELEHGRHWVKGTVFDVNHESGVVKLTSPKAGTLKLHFPPTDIANLKSGDQIAVKMAFEKGRM